MHKFKLRRITKDDTIDLWFDAPDLRSALEKAARKWFQESICDFVISQEGVKIALLRPTVPGEGNVIGYVFLLDRTDNQ